jgi:hypothetical protein
MHPVDGTRISTVKMFEDETGSKSRAWAPHVAQIRVVSSQGIDLYQTILSRGVCTGVKKGRLPAVGCTRLRMSQWTKLIDRERMIDGVCMEVANIVS